MKAKRSKRKTRFKDLSRAQRVAVVISGTVQMVLLVVAETDIQRREPDRIRGRKSVWRVICLLNLIGPLSYFRWGRR